MSKWNTVRDSLERAHADFEFPDGTFTNFTETGYDPNTGQVNGAYDDTIGTIAVEFVPPSMDTTIETEGSSLEFDTSIRAPDDDIATLSGSVIPYGEDSEYPTQVTVEGTTYEVQGKRPEHGSGMTLLRLTEV